MTPDDLAQIRAIFREELALALPLTRRPRAELPEEPPLDALQVLLSGRTSVTSAEAAAALYGGAEHYTRDLMRAARVLRSLGWEHYKAGTGTERYWAFRPAKPKRAPKVPRVPKSRAITPAWDPAAG